MPVDTSKSSTKELRKWQALSRLGKSKDYLEFLKPILEAVQHNKWLDPDQQDQQGKPLFPDLQSFHKAYTEVYGKAKAFGELQTMIEMADAMIDNIAKQEKNKKSYEL